MAFHSFSCIKFPCLIFDLKSHVFLTPTPSRTESFTPSVKTCQVLALHTNTTTQLPCPSLILLLSPRFWETRDQPIPGSFPKKDPGYEVGAPGDLLDFFKFRFLASNTGQYSYQKSRLVASLVTCWHCITEFNNK